MREEAAQSTIEYALLAALIAVAVIAVILLVSTNLQTDYQMVADALARLGSAGSPVHGGPPCSRLPPPPNPPPCP